MRLGVTLHDSSRIRRFTLLMCAIPGKKMHQFQRRKTFLVRFIQGTPPQKMFSLLVKISIERFLRRNEAETLTNFEIEALVSFFGGTRNKIGLIPFAQMLSVTGSNSVNWSFARIRLISAAVINKIFMTNYYPSSRCEFSSFFLPECPLIF